MFAISGDGYVIRENDIVSDSGFPVTVVKIYPVANGFRELLVRDHNELEYLSISLNLKINSSNMMIG